jgi:hypothetical protein
MSELQTAAKHWHTEWAKAFITQVSAEGEYYIKAKFKTMAEMHSAFGALAKLADVSAPVSTPQPNVDEGDGK